ncbi:MULTISPECIES: efflux transporter outer membrane subunit [unclassified Sphingomonas]|uniref:efflux transporter outer membrane subunit n=1 Tax=unclassified Sphingomonas TaxID=196159 RepID=UPI00285D7D9F|nr:MULTISPECIES: efflux transporter outer membrane subunit [unclassified Sphingomonas]MDR6116525.1 NodT family efflux transporter outer membrane factor (OMF) lipoprotein [Sphingomonas sp. SORGH_AS_0789]MDR6149800.1 NodT family efflux transporter outer membrane factor (OMF) lipoprotein [Sphingomonas sp. SORGH_AS_0742]
MRRPILIALLPLAACTVGPDYHLPVSPLAAPLQSGTPIDTVASDADWWERFDDPTLTTLVARAVANNTDVARAAARIDQARAAAQRAGAALAPSLDASAGVESVSQSLRTPFGSAVTRLGLPRGYTQYSVGAQASWEIDLFGGLRRQRESARADLAAAEADAAGIRIAIVAETADAYVSIRTLQVRLGIAGRAERSAASFADLVGQRVREGLSADRELNRATAERERVRATLPALRAALAAQENRLAVLLGTQPGVDRLVPDFNGSIPIAPDPAGSREPADLLRRRPDIVAAERRLAATHARIGSTMAEYYPRLSLSGLLGVAGIGTGGLLTGEAVQAVGSAGLRWRLFDFGRVDADVAAARGHNAEALAFWRGTALSAAEDVETALTRLVEARVERGALLQQRAALEASRDQLRLAYANGVVAMLDVIDADRALLAAEDALASTRGGEARAAIAAYRALGGGWRSNIALANVPSTAR